MDTNTDTDTNMNDDNLTMIPTTGRRPTPVIRVVTYTSNSDEIID